MGHTLGLRHNFKASGQYTLDEINSDKVKGKHALAGSIMDYTPVNFAIKDGKAMGDFGMIDLGDYDYWAIEYGYTFDDPKKVLERVSERGPPKYEHRRGRRLGPDCRSQQRYDFLQEPHRLRQEPDGTGLAITRLRLLDKIVKDGR